MFFLQDYMYKNPEAEYWMFYYLTTAHDRLELTHQAMARHLYKFVKTQIQNKNKKIKK